MNSIPLKEKDALKGAGKFLTSLYRYKIIIGAFPKLKIRFLKLILEQSIEYLIIESDPENL